MRRTLRWFRIGATFVGWLVFACGSSSGGALFSNVGEPSCGSSTLCNSSSGGSADNGVAGLPASNGTGGAGDQGNSGGAAGAGGSSNTGGDIGSGGQGGGGAGGSGREDAGAQGGTAGSGTVSCPVGSYHAVLTGPYRSGLVSNEIGATIDFSVADGGAVQGTFKGPGNAMAAVTGSIDCATGTLSSVIQDGAYGVGLAMVKFSGTFNGMYDPVGVAFSGTWSIMESNSPNNGGTGAWSTR